MPDPLHTPLPPPDPRSGWHLPAPGELPTVEQLSELVLRVLAPNPSPMTLDGTNSYLIAAPGSGVAVLVDPGPDDREHHSRIERLLLERQVELRAVVLTHRHLDHSAAVAGWIERRGVPVLAADPALASTVLSDGQPVDLPGVQMTAVATPGHTDDHLAFRLGDGSLLTGDHVLGRGTSVVARPDGDLEAYLASLRRVLGLGADVLHPGHGPSMGEDPTAVVRYYLDHREFRRRQLLAALEAGPATVEELVGRLYAEVPPALVGAASASLSALIVALERRGQLAWDSGGRCHLVG